MRSPVRLVLVPTGLLLAAAALLRLGPRPSGLRRTLAAVGSGAESPDAGVVALLAALGWLCLAWLLAAVAVSAGAYAPGTLGRASARAARRVAPAAVRRCAGAALGLSVAAGALASPAAYADPPVPVESASPVLGDVGPFDRPVAPSARSASGHRAASPTSTEPAARPSPAPAATAAEAHAFVSLAPGSGSILVQVPGTEPAAPADRPVARPPGRTSQPAADPTMLSGRSAAADADEVVVRRGDTLWGLASAQLGPHARPGEIAAHWRRWYAANRAVIGDDPHLIRPGQRLRAPATSPATTPRSPR